MHSYEQLFRFTKKCFMALGCDEEDATTVADVLITAELRGIESHGVFRIADYYNLWKTKRIDPEPKITIVHETPSTAVVDGGAGLGMVVAKKAMNIAIEKAKNVGTGWVSVRNSNHYGIAGYFSMMALKHDMIGISLTNANPFVAPTFSIDRLLGTNPISVAIPAGKQPPFVADFATTPVARGKIDLMHKRGKKTPLGYVQDKNGKPSDDPNILTQGGAMVPLGGDYEHGSHKGYCLASIVDIFSALLSGAGYGPWVPPVVSFLPVKENPDVKGTGHFFGAMRIDAFRPAEEFKAMMDKWILTFRNSKPAEGQERVLIPGDPEREMEAVRMKEGISVLPVVVEKLNMVASELGIEKI